MNQSRSGVALAPEWALACVNVIPNTASGGLEKLRTPTSLSTAIGLSGPSQMVMYENALTGTKSIVVFFGPDVVVFVLDSFAAAPIDSNPAYNGPTPMSAAVANNLLLFTNGISIPLKFNGAILQFWGLQKGDVPTLGVKAAGVVTLATGRKYRAAYKNTVTGHVGTASDPSASTGVMLNRQQPVTIPVPPSPDTQIDAARVYATLDGGSDYFFHSEHAGPFPITFSDNTPDSGIDQSERAPLINDEPPRAKYLIKWGARIFGFNITVESVVNGSIANPQGIFYTGYNRILVGRPEESIPPSNRLLLQTGADEISGGGVIAAGVVAFDKSNKMFMYRGQPEDITTNAPVEFTLYLQQLPWDIGCSGHFTIQSSAYGLIWRTPDRQVRLFNGSDKPDILSGGVEPLMKRITAGTELNERSALWSYNERNWYLLAIAVDGSAALNRLLMFDLEPGENNVGTFEFNFGAFDSLAVIEMTTGDQKLVIGQGGIIKELTVASKCVNGITQDPTSTSATLGALWRSGYFGTQNPEQVKFMRFSRVSADSDGYSIKRYLVDDDNSTMAAPDIIEVVPLETAKFETNQETRRMSIEIQFPPQDRDCALQLLTNTYIPGAER